MNVDSLTQLEILLLLLICAFIFSTTLINLLYLEPTENDESRTYLIIVSYISIVFFGIALMIFLAWGSMKLWKNSSGLFSSSGDKTPLQKLFGFNDAGWAIVFFAFVALLLAYSAITANYIKDNEQQAAACPQPHQYLYVTSIIMMSFCALVLFIMLIAGGAHLAHFAGKTKKSFLGGGGGGGTPRSSYTSEYKYKYI